MRLQGVPPRRLRELSTRWNHSRPHLGLYATSHPGYAAYRRSCRLRLRLRGGACGIRPSGDLHHVISMGLSGQKDLVRHGGRKSRAPFKLALRSPFRVAQIDASGWWVEPPSSGGCSVRDNRAFWTSDGCHQRMLSCVGRISCPFLKLDSCVSMVQRTVASRLIRFLLVILMIVKETSYLSLQRGCSLQITDGTGAVEEFPLQLRGNSIPAHEHGRAQALQNLFFFLSEGGTVVASLSPLNRLIDMDRHPLFVFGKRRVGLLQIVEFTHFVRRTRCVGEECPEFGCFRSVLLCSEHLTRPFAGRREHNRSPTCPPRVAFIGR